MLDGTAFSLDTWPMRARTLIRTAVCLFWLAAVAAAASAAPRISEFMAENKEAIADEDGDFSDYIEISNPDASAVNLADYSLTDDPLIPRKWIFPSVSLASGEYLLIFASGKNRLGADPNSTTSMAICSIPRRISTAVCCAAAFR